MFSSVTIRSMMRSSPCFSPAMLLKGRTATFFRPRNCRLLSDCIPDERRLTPPQPATPATARARVRTVRQWAIFVTILPSFMRTDVIRKDRSETHAELRLVFFGIHSSSAEGAIARVDELSVHLQVVPDHPELGALRGLGFGARGDLVLEPAPAGDVAGQVAH